MNITLVAAVAAAGWVALPATADTLHDNGLPNGVSAISNATAGVFGARRTILDDFTIPAAEIWRIEDFHWYHLWGSGLPPPAGTGAELALWSDADGRPEKPFHTMKVLSYEEVATGNIFFSRPEALSWITVDPVMLDPGTYWLEWTIIGPENNFAQYADLRDNECWVNYDDLGGLSSGTDQFGVAMDLAWSLTGTVIPPCRADLDGDGEVTFSDLLLVLSAWGICAHQSGCPEDLDDSGDVGFSDIVFLLGEWGELCAPGLTGACCFGDGTCVDLMETICRSQGGAFAGAGTLCADGCPGACCLEDETCIDSVPGTTCFEMGGQLLRGAGTTCADVTCGVLGDCGWIVDAPLTWTGSTCGEANHCGYWPRPPEVRWEITVPHGGSWTFSVCGAERDTHLYAHLTECCGRQFGNGDFCDDDGQLTLNLIAGQVVFLTLETRGNCSDYTLVVSSD